MLDKPACKAALTFTRAFKPDICVIAGDLWNFGAIRKGAGEDERSESMQDDFLAGARFAQSFFGVKSENHLMLGNHDVRVWDMAASPDAVKRDLANRMILDIEGVAKTNKAKLWPYDARSGVLELGHLKVVHGYHTGLYACATHSRIYGNVVFGHVHSIESYQIPGLEQREARAIGCLCQLDQDYINRKTAKLRWAHGWAYGWLFADGTYQLHQARSVEGRFYASKTIEAF